MTAVTSARSHLQDSRKQCLEGRNETGIFDQMLFAERNGYLTHDFSAFKFSLSAQTSS